MAAADDDGWRDELRDALRSDLFRDAPAVRIDPDRASTRFEAYTQRLIDQARVFGLISAADAADPRRILHRHVLESGAGWESVAAGDRRSLYDLGSGAGLPGIPLAILLGEGWRTVLVESRRKRAAFLVDTIAALGLDGVTVFGDDAAALSRNHGDGGPVTGAIVTFRAFLPSDRRLDRILRRAFAAGTPVIAYKSGEVEREVEALGRLDAVDPASIGVTPLATPGIGAARTLVAFRTRGGGATRSG